MKYRCGTKHLNGKRIRNRNLRCLKQNHPIENLVKSHYKLYDKCNSRRDKIIQFYSELMDGFAYFDYQPMNTHAPVYIFTSRLEKI